MRSAVRDHATRPASRYRSCLIRHAPVGARHGSAVAPDRQSACEAVDNVGLLTDGPATLLAPLTGEADEDGKAAGEESEAATGTVDPLAPPASMPPDRWYNAAVPFVVVAVSTFIGMWMDGYSKTQAAGLAGTTMQVFAHADSFRALLWGSLFGCLAAATMLMAQRLMTVGQVVEVRRL